MRQKYSRIDKVKFVEDKLLKICGGMVSLYENQKCKLLYSISKEQHESRQH